MNNFERKRFWLIPQASLVLFITTFFASAGLSAAEMTPGVTLSPAVGFHAYDKEFDLDSSPTYSFALGYQLDNPFAFEVRYTGSETDDANGLDVDVTQYQLDALYHFNVENSFVPYMLIGTGKAEYSNSVGKIDDNFTAIGAGFKYAFTQALSLRSDFRIIGFEDDEHDQAVNVGLHYVFGGKTKSKPVRKIEVDTDKDGVFDKVDKCPNTSAGVEVDASGCEVKAVEVVEKPPVVQVPDADRDGVPDSADQCPNTEAGSKVNSVGCYKLTKEEHSFTLNVTFESNSDVVKNDSQNQIAELAKFLKMYPETNVVLEGYTDSAGSDAYNLQLSERRAMAIRRILVSQYNLPARRINAVGRGEVNPVADNATREGRAKNRRVEAKVRTVIEKRVQ